MRWQTSFLIYFRIGCKNSVICNESVKSRQLTSNVNITSRNILLRLLTTRTDCCHSKNHLTIAFFQDVTPWTLADGFQRSSQTNRCPGPSYWRHGPQESSFYSHRRRNLESHYIRSRCQTFVHKSHTKFQQNQMQYLKPRTLAPTSCFGLTDSDLLVNFSDPTPIYGAW